MSLSVRLTERPAQLRAPLGVGESPTMDIDAIFEGLVGAKTLGVPLHPPNWESAVRGFAPGDWKPFDPSNGFHKLFLNESAECAVKHWERVVKEDIKLDISVGQAFISIDSAGSTQCAFLVLCQDPSGKFLHLGNELQPSSAKSDYGIGNLWVIKQGKAAIQTVFTNEAVADLMIQAANGEIDLPTWVERELVAAIDAYSKKQELPTAAETPVKIDDLIISSDGSSGVVHSNIGRFNVTFGVGPECRPCIGISQQIRMLEPDGQS